jgi:tRNA A-37 threonylcarbamoyl transferase component Bud32
VLDILHKLYCEKEFVNKDMNPENIMTYVNNKVYLIDFSIGIFTERSWNRDLLILSESIDYNYTEEFQYRLEKLEDDESLDPISYRKYIIEYENILFRI